VPNTRKGATLRERRNFERDFVMAVFASCIGLVVAALKIMHHLLM
jgi:hypothetical protein